MVHQKSITYYLLAVVLIIAGPSVVLSKSSSSTHDRRAYSSGTSITDHSFEWPSRDHLVRVVSLRDYNTRIVVLGVTMFGLAAGTIGTFLLLRKRSLTADALAHATLPGIALAFLVMVALGGSGKHMLGLLAGAFFFGVLGVGGILLIRHATRLKDDAALGIILSVFYGLGVALLGIIQDVETGSAAGLDTFILGKAASMLPSDAMIILAVAVIAAMASLVLYKEFKLLCFDQSYAGALGWPVLWLDGVLMGLVVVVTVIGLQSIGLVLVVAMLIIPPAAARFWTESLFRMTITSALIGMVSGYLGAMLSALVPRVPTGPIIVLVAGFCLRGSG